ncbi:MAG: ABC transporter permease [Planctomycetota bacterium]|jgi:ribose transport system permease protein|nr:ABC transporter permease [Planctomycetota bacterium]
MSEHTKTGTQNAVDVLRKFLPVAVFAILVIISSFLSQNFLTSPNIFNLLRQNSATTIVSLGMLMVILTGGIDLSVGSLAAFSSVLFATLIDTRGNDPVPLGLALAFTLACSLAFGALTGYLVAFQRMAPFVVTLASMTAARGVAYMISHAKTIPIANELVNIFNKRSFQGVPYSVLLALIIFVLVALLLKYTCYGRFIQAIGSNETAVRLSGIRTSYYTMSVYMVSAVMCTFGGIIESRTGVGDARVCQGLELDAIAACVIGGASLSGGKGAAVNTLMGVLILGLIGNIMALMKVAPYPQQVIKGLIIIAAVLLQGRDKKR